MTPEDRIIFRRIKRRYRLSTTGKWIVRFIEDDIEDEVEIGQFYTIEDADFVAGVRKDLLRLISIITRQDRELRRVNLR